MRTAAPRPLLVLAAAAVAALGAAAPAGAHGGTTIAKGGADGVSILTQAEVNSETGTEALDMSTTIEGPGTGKGATVTYWIRPSGGKTFRATTTRDPAGIASANVRLSGRGDWRSWDVSAVVDLSTGKRLRVSNAEANPPGPDPAATAGGGATGADDDESATTTGAAPASGGTAPDTATAADPATTTDGATATDDGATASPIEDVSGDDGGTPGWVVPSAIVVLAAAVALVLVVQRRRRAADVRGEDD
jgi:hypothetical protein